MKNVQKFETDVSGKKLMIEIGKFAGQANASVTVQYGDTLVLATAVMGKQPTNLPYFPLMVDYEERLYAAGKIKGSRFIKREGRPSDEAILTGRLVDRCIRPLFDQSLKRDVQVVITVLSIDKINDPDFPALIAASTALSVSDIPWDGPVAGVVMGNHEGAWTMCPSQEEKEANELNIFVAGKDTSIIMIEADGKEVDEKTASEAIKKASKEIEALTQFIGGIQKNIGKEKAKIEELLSEEQSQQLEKTKVKLDAFMKGKFDEVMGIKDKVERTKKMDGIADDFLSHVSEEIEDLDKLVAQKIKLAATEHIELQARKYVIEKGERVDGRKTDELRSIEAEISLIPRAHGSGLFTRGETQVLSVLTLGAPGDKQTLDSMETEGEKDYMHHYNFPGYSVGEVKPLRGPGRREVGHGALAEKALVPVLPKDKSTFPYTIRVVSETLSSNGSSSQASVCGSTLALMDAGVPITAPVAGIAIGLMTDPDSDKHRILTDIQGIEDHAGDMDFKVAGSRKGITAIQLDIKLGGISVQICDDALEAAKIARCKILDIMEQVIKEPRKELSPYAPRIVSLHIDPDKIRDVIGPGGKIINKIIAETDVSIDIEDDGLVMITSTDADMMKKAVQMVQDIVKEVEEGEIYTGKATQIIKSQNTGGDVGVIIQLTPSKDGMVHISEVANERINRISDVINIGDEVKVKVLRVDAGTGRVELSRKALLPRSTTSSSGSDSQDGKKDFRRGNFRDNNRDNRGKGGKLRGIFSRKKDSK